MLQFYSCSVQEAPIASWCKKVVHTHSTEMHTDNLGDKNMSAIGATSLTLSKLFWGNLSRVWTLQQPCLFGEGALLSETTCYQRLLESWKQKLVFWQFLLNLQVQRGNCAKLVKLLFCFYPHTISQSGDVDVRDWGGGRRCLWHRAQLH